MNSLDCRWPEDKRGLYFDQIRRHERLEELHGIPTFTNSLLLYINVDFATQVLLTVYYLKVAAPGAATTRNSIAELAKGAELYWPLHTVPDVDGKPYILWWIFQRLAFDQYGAPDPEAKKCLLG